MSALLTIENLETGYGPSQVLFGVNLEVQSGEASTLLGRNGMGKTTLLKAVFGQLPAWQGEIRFLGEKINGRSTEQIAQMGLALVPEGRQIFPNLSVEENLVAFHANRNKGEKPWKLDDIYELFPRLKERAGNMGNQLSGGEQQMLAVGRALMTNPYLLILDEATEGLSPIIRKEIWQVLARLKEAGQSFLVIDKYFKELVRVTDRHTFVEKGCSVWSGDTETLQRSPDLWKRYMGV
ncbi:ABC transporter ATP-binding protein [Nitrincola sp. MINF-07-Sa-05]|uniref:ABC transporter ATP-binding protein n=1 Tax=Nitrincola salilacus TaxID=3400273 RepID=UPI003917F4D7